MLEIERELNPSQFAAVTTIDGPVLVIAGAGSGKTRVIEYRVLYLVKNKINPNSILLLTFTRRASYEMLSRAARHDSRCTSIEGGTFHSFAYKILKRYARAIGLSESFSVLDEGDSEEAIHRCSTELGLFNRKERFPRKDTLRNIISISINKGRSIKEVLKREYPHFLEYAPQIENLRKEYVEYKINRNYLDYDDLLLYLKLLLEDEVVRDELSQRYQYIMVDEYQDTNKIQGDITYLLGKEHRNVMVVGDDAQSIYGFRGASHENIMEFPKRFPECKIIKLEENYRSTQSILDVANSILENMKNKYSKCLTSARRCQGSKPQLLFFKDAYEEAEWVANKIKELRDEGIALNHQGVLFRSGYISIPLQTELTKRNIPYRVFGGYKFYETAHVKDVMAHLKVIINPRNELAWNRVLMLIKGVGPKATAQLIEEILNCYSLNEIIEGVFHKYNEGLRFSEGLRKLGLALKAAYKKDSVGERFDVIFDYYYPILKDQFDDWHLRFNDLEALRQISMRYNSLEDLLADFTIEPPERGVLMVEPSIPDEERPLTLSTIHSAKGLEWESVFLIGLIDGVLPIGYALRYVDEIEEEHRLFYVAITRAKSHLFLSLHHKGIRGGISQFNKISRFIDVANVLSKLERNDFCKRMEDRIAYTPQKISQIYDKGLLFRRIF